MRKCPGCPAELECRIEVLQDLAPTAVVPGAAAMTLVDDDEVKEVAREIPVQSRPPFVLRDGLVSCEVHVTTFDCLAFDFPAGVSEGRANV